MVEHICNQVENISKIKWEVALTNKDISYMKIEISDIKNEIKELRNDIKDFVSTADNKYATKEELEYMKNNSINNTSTRIERIKSWSWLIIALIWWIITLLTIYFSK